jgi:hypothetical protein
MIGTSDFDLFRTLPELSLRLSKVIKLSYALIKLFSASKNFMKLKLRESEISLVFELKGNLRIFEFLSVLSSSFDREKEELLSLLRLETNVLFSFN